MFVETLLKSAMLNYKHMQITKSQLKSQLTATINTNSSNTMKLIKYLR